MMGGQDRGKTLSNALARRAIAARRQGADFKLLDGNLGSVRGDYQWSESRADAAATALLNLANGLRDRGKRVDAFEFDSVACEALHKHLDPLPPQLAASDGFWRWLAVEKFSEVIERRHMSRQGNPAHLGNYGIDARSERNRLVILWFRADILYCAESDNPYGLATLKMHTDFVESGLLRPRYAWNSTLAKALVKFQYREPETNEAFLHNTDANGIRQMYKTLRQLHSSYAFEAMSYDELWELLDSKSRSLKRA